MENTVIIPAGLIQKYDTLKIKNVPMKTNEHLFHFLPFLRNEYRKLTKKETTSEDVFKEFFPDETEIDLTKLEQIYNFQNVVTVTENPSEIVIDYSAGHIRKVVKNGKV